jgi:dienelactone hydrolase
MRACRWLVWAALSAGSIATGQAANAQTAAGTPLLKGTREGEPAPADALKRYLLGQTKVYFDARRSAIAAIKTPADVERRQKELRAFFLESLGDLPERTPLNPQVVGTLQRDGYRVENVIFESRPRHHVTGNLYIPQGQGPRPGVLVPCGHSDNGKAGETYQRICILLAKNGMVVLCYDPIGQGERGQMLDSSGKPVIRNTTEHTMAGIGALLVGRQLASYRIWDGFRALDYLASRPEVDPKRLGCTGNSGGGTMTAYLMALDDRISVAAPSCYITSLERLFATIGPQDAEQNINGQVAAGMEHADYVTMRAPKPTLLSVGTRDFFDIRGSWDTYREVKLIFGRMGFGERIDLFESDEEHGFTKPRRVAAARWMSRWLLKRDEALDEPEFPIATDQELQCTRSGQVLTDFHGVSVFDLNRERERELRKLREAVGGKRSLGELRAEVRKRLGLREWEARRLPVGTERGESANVVRFGVEPDLTISGVQIQDDGLNPDRPTLVIVGADRRLDFASGFIGNMQRGPYHRVLSLDLRGLGTANRAPAPPGRESPFGADWREAFVALSIDRPLLGQRAAELLNVLETLLESRKLVPGFHLVGVGAAGPVVLHAALLDGGGLVKKVTLQSSLVSWSNVVERGLSRNQLSSVLPGVLASYDLPDLAAAIAPLPLAIVDAVDAEGKAVSLARVREIYAGCIKKYGADGSLEIR